MREGDPLGGEMQTSTSTRTERSLSSSQQQAPHITFKFPRTEDTVDHQQPATLQESTRSRSASPLPSRSNGHTGNLPQNGRWHAKKENLGVWSGQGMNSGVVRHSRERSLSQALKHVRTRRDSASAGELVDALKAPVSPRLVVSLPWNIWRHSAAASC